MATITEDYVSFEVAKLLKEKGFNGLCNSYYDCFTTDNFHSGCEPIDFNSIDTKIRKIVSAPTLQMAMKWLRNTFHLEIYPFHDAIQENNDWWYRIEQHSKGCSLTEHESDAIYKTYEEACEAAIKYCLENLI